MKLRRWLFVMMLLLGAAGANAQGRISRDSLPYRKYPSLPAFDLLLRDSTTFNTFNLPTGKPIAIIFFSSDCGHCDDVINALLQGMDTLNDVRFVFACTSTDLKALRLFYDKHRLGSYKNIEAVGIDVSRMFTAYYGIHFVPDVVIYDQDKHLLGMMEKNFTASYIYDLLY